MSNKKTSDIFLVNFQKNNQVNVTSYCEMLVHTTKMVEVCRFELRLDGELDEEMVGW